MRGMTPTAVAQRMSGSDTGSESGGRFNARFRTATGKPDAVIVDGGELPSAQDRVQLVKVKAPSFSEGRLINPGKFEIWGWSKEATARSSPRLK